MYSMAMIDNNTILHVWKLLRVGFKSFYRKKKILLTVMMDIT